MADLLASIFGGGSQTAPVMPTVNTGGIQQSFLGQNFGAAQSVSDAQTKNTSATNLATDITGLNTVDSGALSGINEEQTLGNNLLSGSASALPAWAKNSMNDALRIGSESAIGRGVGAFSNNGLSGVNEYVGNNALNLVNLGAGLANNASTQSQGIVNANMYRADPNMGLLSPGQFLQAGEFNAGIQGQNAQFAAAAQNFNNNNSPLGNAIRTGLSDITALAGSFLGSGASAMPAGNSGSGGGVSTLGGGSGGGAGGGLGLLMGLL